MPLLANGPAAFEHSSTFLPIYQAVNLYSIFGDDAASILRTMNHDTWRNLLGKMVQQKFHTTVPMDEECATIGRGLEAFQAYNGDCVKIGFTISPQYPWLVAKIHAKQPGRIIYFREIQHPIVPIVASMNLYRELQVSMLVANVEECLVVNLVNNEMTFQPIHFKPGYFLRIQRGQNVSRFQHLENFYFYKLLEHVDSRISRGFLNVRPYDDNVERLTTHLRWREFPD